MHQAEHVPSASPRQLPLMDAFLKDELRSIEDTAKQLISLSSLISSIYFGTLSFAKMSGAAARMPNLMLALLPMLFWLVTLLLSVLALAPRTPASGANEGLARLIGSKQRYLRISLACFVVSILALIGVLGAVLAA
jgi:hypothetical protein